MYCKNLDCNALELLLVQVDKKNLIELLFNCYTLLIHILLFTSIYKVLHISFESFPRMPIDFLIKEKEKEKKYK